jgi:solute carrier family 8 (sodium/calcium exchanger)
MGHTKKKKNKKKNKKILQGKPFIVQSGSLGFSVGVYSCLAVVGIGVLMLRRSARTCGFAELGGPQVTKYLTAFFFICLWIVYILLSSFEAYGIIKPNF